MVDTRDPGWTVVTWKYRLKLEALANHDEDDVCIPARYRCWQGRKVNHLDINC